jgi:hypothetical protein
VPRMLTYALRGRRSRRGSGVDGGITPKNKNGGGPHQSHELASICVDNARFRDADLAQTNARPAAQAASAAASVALNEYREGMCEQRFADIC